MTPDERHKKETRLELIRKQIADIPAILDGVLMTKHNRVKRKDGSIRVSPAHYTFQYRGPAGERKWKRVPKSTKSAVERLLRAGQRYRTLEQEYRALLTELSLDSGSKKND